MTNSIIWKERQQWRKAKRRAQLKLNQDPFWNASVNIFTMSKEDQCKLMREQLMRLGIDD